MLLAVVLTESMVVGAEEPVTDTDEDENVQAAPAGRPPQLTLTVPVNPFTGVTVIVELPDPPAVTVRLAGFAATVKSLTVSVTAVEVEAAKLLSPL
jgi:hypothetical protein